MSNPQESSSEKPELIGGRDSGNEGYESANTYANLGHEGSPDGATPELPRKIERSDLTPPHLEAGDTLIALVRHGKYDRNPDSPGVGSLTPEAQAAEYEASLGYFRDILTDTPPEERADVEFLFVASDTSFMDGGRRSYETASLAEQAALQVLDEFELPSGQVINATSRLRDISGRRGTQPKPMPGLREPKIFDDTKPDFAYFEFLLDKYGSMAPGSDFWLAFEEDWDKDKREELGAEGPDQIADRAGRSLKVLGMYGDKYHEANPDKRLVIYAGTHYDLISPLVKRDVLGEAKEALLSVENGSGISIHKPKDGPATTKVAGTTYEIPLGR